MIYLLAALVNAFVITGFIGGAALIAHGIVEGTWREPIAGALIFVAVFTIVYAAIGQLAAPKENCGVGTEYVPEINGHDWYCKADKDY